MGWTFPSNSSLYVYSHAFKMPKLSEVISWASRYLIPFSELCGIVDFFLQEGGGRMRLSCVSSLMQTDCDKSTSFIITEIECANILGFFSVFHCFVCSPSTPTMKKKCRNSSFTYSVHFLACPELHTDLEVGRSSGLNNKDFAFKRESNKAENQCQSKTAYPFG